MGKSAITISGKYKDNSILARALIVLAFICMATVVTSTLSLVKADTVASDLTVAQALHKQPSAKPGSASNRNSGRPRPPPPGVHVYRDLEYARVDGQSLRLDLYMAEDSVTPPPLIIWIHGGGWAKGDKSRVNPAAMGLSAKGYAFASINYRLGGLALHPKQIHDIKAAVRWLRANAGKYGYDASRIGVGGGSAGGHLALLLGLSANDDYLEGDVGGNLEQSSRVQAVLDLYGPSALLDYAQVSKRFRRNKSESLLRSASPLSYLSSDDPPLLIMHGDLDHVVPISQSEILHKKYQQAGLDSTLHVVNGAAHGGMAFSGSTQQGLMKAFFDLHLKNHAAKKSIESNLPVVSSAIPGQPTAKKNVNDGDSNVFRLHGFHWIVGPKAGLRGSDERFNRLLREIDRTLSADSLISGVYIITHWNLIEEQEGRYDFERLDRIIKLIRSHGRYYKLAVAPGIYSPEWLYRKGAEAFVTVGSNPQRVDVYNKEVKIPLPWNTVYQASYFALLDKVAVRYGDDKYFRAVTVTAATFMSPEWHLPHSAADRRQWRNYNNYTGKLEKAWKDILDYFARLFPSQILIIEASSYPLGDKVLADSIVDYGVKTYAGRFAIQINQLSGRFDQINRPTYAKLLDYRNNYGSDIIIGLQNIKGWSFPGIRKKQGSMEMTVFNYLQADAEYWELWYGDGKNSVTTEKLQKLIEQGHALGLKKFKEKLITEGKYKPPVARRHR